jgi:hypothetical protein
MAVAEHIQIDDLTRPHHAHSLPQIGEIHDARAVHADYQVVALRQRHRLDNRHDHNRRRKSHRGQHSDPVQHVARALAKRMQSRGGAGTAGIDIDYELWGPSGNGTVEIGKRERLWSTDRTLSVGSTPLPLGSTQKLVHSQSVILRRRRVLAGTALKRTEDDASRGSSRGFIRIR